MVDDVPLAILVEAVQRVFPGALVVLADPRRTVRSTDGAHGVQGYAGDSVGRTGALDAWVSTKWIWGIKATLSSDRTETRSGAKTGLRKFAQPLAIRPMDMAAAYSALPRVSRPRAPSMVRIWKLVDVKS